MEQYVDDDTVSASRAYRERPISRSARTTGQQRPRSKLTDQYSEAQVTELADKRAKFLIKPAELSGNGRKPLEFRERAAHLSDNVHKLLAIRSTHPGPVIMAERKFCVFRVAPVDLVCYKFRIPPTSESLTR